jgi:heme/copper-type cytochrome/quinol oxidase subunit 1
MEPFVRNFIRASLVWFCTGVLLGLWQVASPVALVYRPAHMHANLLGFVSMMIFGVAYHVLPRFAGTPLRSRGVARVHFWMANTGLALMVGGWLGRVTWPEPGGIALMMGAIASAAGAFLFIGNIWLTIGVRQSGAIAAARRPEIIELRRRS